MKNSLHTLNLLRKTRIFVAIFVGVASLSFFMIRGSAESDNGFYRFIELVGSAVMGFQFVPAFLSSLSGTILAVIIIISILVMTFLWGRIYCSALCPMGVLQDLFAFIGRPFRKSRFVYTQGWRWVWYASLALTCLCFLFGLTALVGLADPYSLYGKLLTYGLRPLAIKGYNAFGSIFDHFDIYLIIPVQNTTFLPMLTLISGLALLALATASSLRGRLFCNTLCPLGALLGLISRVSRYKLTLSSACINCGKCVKECRAGCIDLTAQLIENDRCVRCLDCTQVCPVNAIGFSTQKVDSSANIAPVEKGFLTRKSFLTLGTTALAFSILPKKIFSQDIYFSAARFPLPPGGKSREYFEKRCTACGLCSAKCPTGVIRPAFMEHGASGLMQPLLDYTKSFCEYGCTVCSRVCPTGALQPLARKDKEELSIGEVHFVQSKCIVETHKTACGACAEVCPTNAVIMVPYAKGLTIPETDQHLCTGCGACEYQCPVRPSRAIFVTGRTIHRKIIRSVKKKEIHESMPVKKERKATGDFPF